MDDRTRRTRGVEVSKGDEEHRRRRRRRRKKRNDPEEKEAEAEEEEEEQEEGVEGKGGWRRSGRERKTEAKKPSRRWEWCHDYCWNPPITARSVQNKKRERGGVALYGSWFFSVL